MVTAPQAPDTALTWLERPEVYDGVTRAAKMPKNGRAAGNCTTRSLSHMNDEASSDKLAAAQGSREGKVFIFVKGRKRGFEVPTGWRILWQSAPGQTAVPQASPQEMVARSLRNPIGSERIRDLATRRSKVAILVDDDTRPTPVKQILPLVLQELRDSGVSDGNINIIVAVGTHQPLQGDRLEKRLGADILKEYRVTNHDSWASDLVRIGVLRDIVIRANPIVAHADVKIGIGTILPHPLAGFGGGPKIVMPGICGYDTIREHHTSTLLEPGSYLGNVKGNPFYDFVCNVSAMVGLDYVIDCVVDAQGQALEIVSGHPIKAQQAGIATCRQIYGAEFTEEADVTIASAHPHEEGPQIIKPIIPAVMTTKEGGTLILAAACEEGLPEPFLRMFDLVRYQDPDDPMRAVLEHMRARKAFVPDSPMDFNCAIQSTFACLRHLKVILVSENVGPAQAARIGFEHAPDLETGLDMARELRPEASVNVLAAGGIVLPLVERKVDLFGA